MKSTALLALAAAALVISPVAAAAHGIYFGQRSGKMAMLYGEGGEDDDMVARLPLLETMNAYDADYQPIPAKHRTAGAVVLVDAEKKPTVLTAVLQNGVWSKMEGGKFEKKGLDQMPGATVSENYIKYGVSIQGPLTKPMPALPGQTLQIVPIGAIPTRLGQPLKYRVLFKGKPVKGVALINDMLNDPEAKPALTGADGTATLKVRNQGLNVLRASYKSPSENPSQYKITDHTATLAFTLALLED